MQTAARLLQKKATKPGKVDHFSEHFRWHLNGNFAVKIVFWTVVNKQTLIRKNSPRVI